MAREQKISQLFLAGFAPEMTRAVSGLLFSRGLRSELRDGSVASREETLSISGLSLTYHVVEGLA